MVGYGMKAEIEVPAPASSLIPPLHGSQPDQSASPSLSTEVGLARSMKGYELYSWQEGGDWHFALLVGTNRLKTHDEVTSPDVRVQGTEALKRELSRLPSEERVFWSTGLVEGMAMPSDNILSEISTHCEQLGVQLVVDR